MLTDEEPSSPFLRALRGARALGRADGRLAVEIEPAGEPAATGSWCHGLDPEDLARLVWDVDAGPPPAGVVLNAPSWYAQGFREALACARAQQARRTVDDARPAEHCRPPTGSRTPCAQVCVALPAPVARTAPVADRQEDVAAAPAARNDPTTAVPDPRGPVRTTSPPRTTTAPAGGTGVFGTGAR